MSEKSVPKRQYTDEFKIEAVSLAVAANVLDRRFDGWPPDRAWVSDITFVRTGKSWLYLAAILDLASRRVVGWSMSERIDAELVCQALRSACWQRKPAPGLLLHSDRGRNMQAGDTGSWSPDSRQRSQ
ncbi:DDE-type integrase/transposase/recombinase (plasmid) [Burkholderia glumae]|nr:DDE-type integrase/transposase/recombinase [Burkholderia glumae]